MSTRNTFPLILVICIPLLILTGAFAQIGRALSFTPTPYSALLDTPLNAITAHSDCYPDTGAYRAYCIQRVEGGSLAFSLSDDMVKYVSVSGRVYDVRIGDLIAQYGQPDRVYTARYYAGWVWEHADGLRIAATSRYGNVWARVRWVMVTRVVGE